MKEVVTWLCGLCKLGPLHSWNGLRQSGLYFKKNKPDGAAILLTFVK